MTVVVAARSLSVSSRRSKKSAILPLVVFVLVLICFLFLVTMWRIMIPINNPHPWEDTSLVHDLERHEQSPKSPTTSANEKKVPLQELNTKEHQQVVDTNANNIDMHKQKLDELLVKEGIQPRAFSPWDVTKAPLPCFRGSFQSTDLRGFLFIKPAKSGSTTGATLTLRLASNIGKKQRGFEMCKCSVEHKLASKMGIRKRDPNKSFLWSVLRDPTARSVSHYFHFQVSRRGLATADTTFRKYLKSEKNFEDYFIRYLMEQVPPEFQRVKNQGNKVASILQQYNFLALTERMDESTVLLQMLLGLETSDVLFLKSKTSGGYDDGRYLGKCFRIAKSFVSPGMTEYFSSKFFRDAVYWDELLHHAVDRSLDMTIDALGRDLFQENLKRFQKLQLQISNDCFAKVKYPCSDTGIKRKDDETDCIFNDWGCGFDCIDASIQAKKNA